MPERDARFVQQHRRRLVLLLFLLVVLAAVTATGPLHRAIVGIVALAEPVVRQHPVSGAILFVLLAAVSAVVFFFSSAAITPVAVEAFGPSATIALLWLGWIAGGLTTFAIGKYLGRRVASWFVDPLRIREYERKAKRLTSFRDVLLFQLAMPSEIPGYVLGLAGCRFRTFALAMSLGELPFAIGAVYLGESFLTRQYALLIAIGLTGIAFNWAMFRRAGRTDERTGVSA